MWITQRGATDEIREHLKHLGPSNLASRPRQTRYNTVKIKRSGTSPSRSAQTDMESGQSTSESQPYIPAIGYQGGIGAGLVNSGSDAKDGAHALKIGYGTIAPNDAVTKSTGSQQYKDLPQMSIPDPVHEEGEEQTRSSSTQKDSSRTGSIKSVDSHSEFIYHHRGPARSGSITEQIVDVNGIRKVVLHTTGTSSSDGEDKIATKQEDQQGDHPDHASSHSNAKKRRRRKKRGQNSKHEDGEHGEDQPLLQ